MLPTDAVMEAEPQSRWQHTASDDTLDLPLNRGDGAGAEARELGGGKTAAKQQQDQGTGRHSHKLTTVTGLV